MAFTKDIINYLLVIIISLIVVLDLWLHPGIPATFDGTTHITAIAQFQQTLQSGDFPVVWTDNFANYGLPLGIFAHQLPNYVGAVLSIFIQNYIVVYKLLITFSVLLSGLFFYRFLRIYFSSLLSLLGTVIFTFAPYKIINIYIRGALPELFSSIFVPLILINLHTFVKKRSFLSVIFLLILFTLLALTHPMLFVIYLFIFIPYFMFLLVDNVKMSDLKDQLKEQLPVVVIFIGLLFFAIAISSYYYLPLLFENQYFIAGQHKMISTYQFLDWKNFLNLNWYYFYKSDIFYRGQIIQTGIIEFSAVVLGFGVLVFKWLVKKMRTITYIEFAILTGLLLLFFTANYSYPFHKYIPLFAAIQFPWRLLSAFIFLPGIIIPYFLKDLRQIFIVLFMILFGIQYLPQLYGKNYTIFPNSYYQFTAINLYSSDQNTLWSAKTQNYPVKPQKAEIISGKGKITSKHVKNSSREYTVNAKTAIRMVDYTFYFPGWKVYVDSKPIPIEFQDQNYRGVITYNVPAGRHAVIVRFEDTKLRFFAKILSIFSLIVAVIALIFIKRKKYLEVRAA